MDTNNRLKQVREALRLSQKDFSEQLGVKQSYYSEVENSKRPVGHKIISSLLDKFQVSSDWMLTGKGDINITNSEHKLTGLSDGFDDGFKQTDMHGNNTRDDARFKENLDNDSKGKNERQNSQKSDLHSISSTDDISEEQKQKWLDDEPQEVKESRAMQRIIQSNRQRLIGELVDLKGDYEGFYEAITDLRFFNEVIEGIESDYFRDYNDLWFNSDKEYVSGKKFDYNRYKNDVLKQLDNIKGFREPLLKLRKAIFTFCSEIKELDVKEYTEYFNDVTD